MLRIHWKSKRVVWTIISLCALYLTIRIKSFEHKASVFLKNTSPNEVWEYVADFSNMKFLNPTIINFNIIAEEGNYDHWKYSTQYSEYLSHWPYLRNEAVAHFTVKSDTDRNIYMITSVHKTCMLFGLICLNSKSEFRFRNGNSSGALCEESIVYQCPALLASLCRREVTFQREAIMKNLQLHFLRK